LKTKYEDRHFLEEVENILHYHRRRDGPKEDNMYVCVCVYVLEHLKSYKFTLIYITADNMRGFINKSDLYLTWKIMKFHIWNTSLDGAETLTLRKIDQKHSGRIKMWWRKMETIGWVDRVENEVLLRVKKERNVPHTTKRRKANWIGPILRKNCFLKYH
jgi:hypothetical protein